MNPILQNFAYFLGLVIGFYILVKAADWFTEAAVEMARRFRVPHIIIGATVVSLATTLPELAVSFLAACQGKVDLAVGNAVGSTICNVGLILGLCALLSPMVVEQNGFVVSGMRLLIIGLIFGGLGYLVPEGSRWVGVIMVLCLIMYLAAQLRTALAERRKKEPEETDFKSWSWIWGFFFVGAFGVVLGSRVVVFCAECLARALGVSELVIALTIVAVGTSMPEFMVSLTAILRKRRALSLGNIIGANVLNLVWVIGASSLVRPLPLQRQTLVFDIPTMWLFSVLLLIFGRTDARVARWEGATLLGLYIVYVFVTVFFFRQA
ncbi:MAG TPA: calcium/sodium antiporter [Candidatus Hydrogenedentes bacterium]|nr:calcium/sodium antiporter [Candidatus Hydrogenedentota bacterium]HOL76031.1 calcium/sodium antiporter [Candidatus Hydrogenedentota bacterium]HPO84645.1 calcium/sodium antiporter [Candidatus Hydrogenedentota bacterium]